MYLLLTVLIIWYIAILLENDEKNKNDSSKNKQPSSEKECPPEKECPKCKDCPPEKSKFGTDIYSTERILDKKWENECLVNEEYKYRSDITDAEKARFDKSADNYLRLSCDIEFTNAEYDSSSEWSRCGIEISFEEKDNENEEFKTRYLGAFIYFKKDEKPISNKMSIYKVYKMKKILKSYPLTLVFILQFKADYRKVCNPKLEIIKEIPNLEEGE